MFSFITKKRQGGLGKSRKYGIQTGDGGCEDSRQNQATQTHRQLRYDPNRINEVVVLPEDGRLGTLSPHRFVVCEQSRSNHQHEGGEQKSSGARDHSLAGIPCISAAKHSLGIELIYAKGTQVLKGHRDNRNPKGKTHGRVGGQVEKGELFRRNLAHLSPSTVQLRDNPEQTEQTGSHKKKELHDVRPNDRPHSSHQSPKHRKESNEPDAFVEIHGSDDFKRQSGDQNPNALSEDSTNLKDEGGQAFGSHSESVAHVIVRTVDLAFVENLNEENTHQNPGDDRSDSPLKVGEVSTCSVDHAGDADESDPADFRGYDRTGDRGPW